MTWLDTDPRWVALVLSGALLAYYVAVEPWWGRSMFARLERSRPHDPTALVAFYRVTVGVQVATVAAVAVAVLADAGVGAGSIGLALPAAPDSSLTPLLAGAVIGTALALGAGLLLGLRAARAGQGLPVAPVAISPMIPVTRTERWWAAAVAVGAGISEELVFRGLLLAVAVGLGMPPVLAAVGLTVVFGMAHLYQGIRGVVTTALFGGVMSAIALGTESLLVPIVLHAAVDLRSLLLTRPAATG